LRAAYVCNRYLGIRFVRRFGQNLCERLFRHSTICSLVSTFATKICSEKEQGDFVIGKNYISGESRMKFLADAYEALVAAVLLDTKGNLDETWKVFEADFSLPRNVIEQRMGDWRNLARERERAKLTESGPLQPQSTRHCERDDTEQPTLQTAQTSLHMESCTAYSDDTASAGVPKGDAEPIIDGVVSNNHDNANLVSVVFVGDAQKSTTHTCANATLMDQRGSSCASAGERADTRLAGGSCSSSSGSSGCGNNGSSPSVALVASPLPKPALTDPGPLAPVASPLPKPGTPDPEPLKLVASPFPKSGVPDPGPLAIMALNEYCQKSHQTLAWADKTLGLTPPRFEIGALVGGQQMPACEGHTKKEAKGHAAHAALQKLVQLLGHTFAS